MRDSLKNKNSTWYSIDTRKEYAEQYPYLPERIIDNLITKKSQIAVIQWFISKLTCDGRD